jgi:hypothetical protein
VCRLADQAAHLGAGPLGRRGPRHDRVELLIATTTADKQAQGPRPEVAARIAADDQESMLDRAEVDRRVAIL